MLRLLVGLFICTTLLLPQTVLAKNKIQLAKDYIAIGENQAAQNAIQEAILANPTSGDVQFQAGILYLELNDLYHFDKAMNNACKLSPSKCQKIGKLYFRMAFYNLKQGGNTHMAITHLQRGDSYAPKETPTICKKLLEKGEVAFNANDIRMADVFFESLRNLDISYTTTLIDLYTKKAPQVSAEDGVYLLKRVIDFNSGEKKRVAKIAAELAKNDKYSKKERKKFKKFAKQNLSKKEFADCFPPDFREFKVGIENAYMIENMKAGESNGFYIRQPMGFPTWRFVASYGTGIKAVLRDGREYDLAKGFPLPDGDFDFKLVAYKDGAKAQVWFEIPDE